MDITVTFEKGEWTTDPSPAIVIVGTKVRWILRAPSIERRALLWSVVFRDQLPFGKERATLEAKTQVAERLQRMDSSIEFLRRLNLNEEAELNHRGITEAQSADQPGAFKYELSIQDALTGERIGDDDPWLIVLSGSVNTSGRPFAFYLL